jgi:dUTPase
MPARATRGSVGYDLAVAETAVIGTDEYRVLGTGLELVQPLPLRPFAPDGAYAYEMQIRPRSSLFRKYGLLIVNSPGTVDPDYVGHEIGILVYRPNRLPALETLLPEQRETVWFSDPNPVTIPAGTAIAQAVFVRVELPGIYEETDTGVLAWGDPDAFRTGGIGSTG